MSRYQMPTRRKVTETIEEAYKLQFQQIKKELNEDADFVNVTTGISVHFVKKMTCVQ